MAYRDTEIVMEAPEVPNTSSCIAGGDINITSCFDHKDDAPLRVTGTLVFASAKIVTSIIGSGILSLSWASAQLGPIAGPIALLMFSGMAWYGATLLAECYKFEPHENDTRNYAYMDAVRGANLGVVKLRLCGITLYINLVGITIGYVVASSSSMVAIKRCSCFREHGRNPEGCDTSSIPSTITFGVIQIVLSQLPDFQKLSLLSVMDALISVVYTCIILGLSVARVAGGGQVEETRLTGTGKNKVWGTFSAIGDMAFAYAFSYLLIEIQDNLTSDPPSSKVIMKRAIVIGISLSTMLYVLCGILGYLAFGDNVPDNLLTGFGFFEPFWLVDLANLCVVVHLMVSYQVYCKPVFVSVEKWKREKWPNSRFVNGEYAITLPHAGQVITLSWFRVVWRTAYVIFTTVVAIVMFPFFNDFMGLLGAASFWPLTVYFPIQMFISHANIPQRSPAWILMQIMSFVSLVISLLAAVGSLHDLIISFHAAKFFDSLS